MTSLPPNADELVSAYLDGEAAPDEVAVVEASAELMARVDSLRSISGLVGAPITPPAAQREAHLAAALDLFDELRATPADEPAVSKPVSGLAAVSPATGPGATPAAAEPPKGGTVTSFARARDRRRPRRAGLLAAAAAALLLFVGVTALNIGRGDSDSVDLADEATTATDAGGDAADSANLEPADDAARAFDTEAPAAAAAEPETMALEADDGALDAEAADEGSLDDSAGAVAADSDMADQEEAAEDEAGDDTAFAQEAEAPRVDAYFLGDFVLDGDLADELGRLTADDIDERLQLGDGLFPSCQAEIPELANVPTSTLVARARIADRAVEVHRLLVESDVATLLVVDERTCEVSAEVAVPG